MKWNSNSLDCKRRGSHNASGNISFIAPMKIKFLEAVVLKDIWRCGGVLFAFLFLLWSGTAPGSAQLKNQKRVTSLQLTGASQGSRVTIISDSTLSDYEAFRRGDRFYVKIPLAYFNSSLPRFRGDGFEDVQVQKVGGSVLVSFQLQPGASARVDQRSNRLDVTFSAPNRMARRNTGSAGANRATTGATAGIGPLDKRQTLQGRERITAGPIPPSTPQSYRERTVTERASERQARQAALGQVKPPIPSNKSVNSPSATNTPTPDKSVSRPPVNPASTSAAHPAAGTATPNSNSRPNAAVSPAGLVESPEATSRIGALLDWFAAHRLLTLLVVLIVVGLILFYASAPNRRLMNTVRRNRLKGPRLKPTNAVVVPVNSGAASTGSSKAHNEYATPLQSERSASPPATVPAQVLRTSAVQENSEPSRPTVEPATAPSVGAAAPRSPVWALAEPTIGVGGNKSSREDQEREVFEL